MGAFVDWDEYLASGLSNTPHELLVADTYYIVVNSINVTNVAPAGGQPIRVTLDRIRTTDGTPDIVQRVPQPQNLLIEANTTVDILNGVFITLKHVTDTPNVSDSLEIFSYGPTQFFNCTVNYMILKELPAL